MKLKRRLVDWLASDVVRDIQSEARDKTLRRAYMEVTIKVHGRSQKKSGLCAGDIIDLALEKTVFGVKESTISIEIDAIKSWPYGTGLN